MIRLLNVVGARPNFMKIAPLIEELKKFPEIEHRLVHSGQHYVELPIFFPIHPALEKTLRALVWKNISLTPEHRMWESYPCNRRDIWISFPSTIMHVWF
jgi:hypothetical protein